MNNEKIQNLRRIISEALTPLIVGDYVLLDVPNHCNIGDNLIWEGELQYLKQQIPYKCLYSANVENWEESKIKDADIILFHGGVNWGDLYRKCQDLRNYIANKYKNKRIIIFPQTVWYNDNSLLKEDCEIFENHPDIYICVRDRNSYEKLSKYLGENKLLLLPDMAFFIDVPFQCTKGSKVLYMQRTDSEVSNRDILITQNYDIRDWPTYSNNKCIYRIKSKWATIVIMLSRQLQKCPILHCCVDSEYGIYNKKNRMHYINVGVQLFSQYHTIYTTRLHGLILGLIMGKKVIIVDNKYNKCLDFYNTWLKDFIDVDVMEICDNK